MSLKDTMVWGTIGGGDTSSLMDKNKDTKITTALSDAIQDDKLRFFTSGEKRMIIDDNRVIFNNKLVNKNSDTIYELTNLPDKTTTLDTTVASTSNNAQFGQQVAIFEKYAIVTQVYGTLEGDTLPLAHIYEEDENGD